MSWFKLAILVLSVFALMTHLMGANTSKLEMDLSNRRAEIRETLLKYTPLGSSSDAVLAFIKTRLKHKGNPNPQVDAHPARGSATDGSARKGAKRIKVILGDYLASPLLFTMDIPMPLLSEICVQWAFDKENRLIEIFVERKAEGP